MRFLLNRNASGTDWTTSTFRIQHWVDATGMGYIDFNPANGNNCLALGTGSNELMRLSSNGNVGIGSNTPAYKLDIVAGKPNDGLRLMYNNTGYVLFQPNSLGQSNYNPITQNGDAGIVYGNYNTSNPATSFGFIISPWSNALSGIRMDPAGNVGIACSNTQGYTLAVNGTAIFTKVVVKTFSNWPDYVFKKNFQHPSLDSLERYIKANSHLPEIPSADSIAKTGLDLGANQATLLKKIEELTLYVIELNKKNEILEKKFQKLRKQIKKKD